MKYTLPVHLPQRQRNFKIETDDMIYVHVSEHKSHPVNPPVDVIIDKSTGEIDEPHDLLSVTDNKYCGWMVGYNGVGIRSLDPIPKPKPEKETDIVAVDLPSRDKLIMMKSESGGHPLEFREIIMYRRDGSRITNDYAHTQIGLTKEETEYVNSCPSTNYSGSPVNGTDGVRHYVYLIGGKIHRGNGCGASIR